MKKHIALIAAIMAFTLSGCTFFDNTDSSDNVNANSSEISTSTESHITEQAAITESTTAENPTETNGGNPDNTEYTYYKVTVSEDKYFTENGEISLDELIGEVSVLNENYVVQIIDDNASLKAYETLTAMLYDISVPYMEENGEIQQ